MAPNPTKRANIIDICTDWWVNQGYEHSLLQVAEDMANLTPVRLEILLALAPVSPSDKTAANPLESEQAGHEPNYNVNNAINPQEGAGEPVVAQVAEPDSAAKKRAANQSFDQSLTQTTAKGSKKKKTKNESQIKSNRESEKVEELIEQVSDKVKDESGIDNNKGSETCEEERQPSQTMKDIERLKVNNEMNSNIIKNELNVENSKAINESMVSMTSQNDVNKEIAEPMECLEKNVSDRDKVTENEPKVSENDIELVTETNTLNNQTKCEVSESETNDEQKYIVNDAKVAEAVLKAVPEAVHEVVQGDHDKQVGTKTQENRMHQKVKTEDETSGENKSQEKKRPERRASVKRPGKLSIPNLWNKSIDESDTQSSKSSDKNSETRSERKAPFIPVGFRVSDAKRAFERRCSVPVNNLQHSSSNLNKSRDSDISEEDTKRRTSRPRAPKLNTRSMSLNVMLESPKKVQELLKKGDKSGERIEDKDVKNKANKVEENKIDTTLPLTTCDTSSVTNEAGKESISSPIVSKDMAKDILKKSIAKAQLKQKKNTSKDSPNSSPVTTPLLSIENSDVSVLTEPAFIGKECKVDLRPRPKTEDKEVTKDVESVSSQKSFASIEQVATEGDGIDNNDKIDKTQSKPQPIARSYKKVTFTKDGATITETGKIYSSEGSDGLYTRVERKSKVTHFPSLETQSKNSEDSLHRSDSQSSSGSVDIFDDIFDDHWTGDEILFPNMKSIMQGLTGKAKTRRRSRAESCERNSSDWYGFRKNGTDVSEKDGQEDDLDMFSSNLRPARPLASLFDKSIFSRHFSDFDKEFEDSFHSIGELNRTASKDRASMSGRVHPTSFKVVFGPQTSVRSTNSKTAFDNDLNDYVVESPAVTNDSRNRLTDRSRESESRFPRKTDSFDNSQKRVEQWLQSDSNNDDNEDLDSRKDPLSMYATIGPRGVRRYLRTMTSRANDSRTNVDGIGSLSGIGVLRTSSQTNSGSKATVARDTVLDLRFNLNAEPGQSGQSGHATNQGSNNGQVLEADVSDDFQSSIVLPESSSLLDQLRTHGYRNIVSQRLSGPSLFTDLDPSLSESDNKTYKRGNGVLKAENAGAREWRECMTAESTNPKASSTSSSISSESASVATHTTHTNGHNMDSASEFANHIDFTELISESLNNCLNQQSCEPTSRSTATRNPSNNSKNTYRTDRTDYHLDQNQNQTQTHRNPTHVSHVSPDITTNKNVNFKESVQERIHRKSFYSRFNDRPSLSSLSRHRRRSFIDTEDIDFALGLKSPSLLTRSSNSFRNSLSLDSDLSPEKSYSVNSLLSKPPSNASDWFTRMESRASQLMDDLLQNDRTFSFSDNNSHRVSRKSSESGFSSNLLRRRSASATRSPLLTPLSHKSGHSVDSFNTTDHHKQNDLNFGNLERGTEESPRSPTEVIRRAIDILSQTSGQNSHLDD